MAAYRALLAAVQALHAKGVAQFPGDKVHRLLIAAAAEHGWCTDLEEVQQRRLKPDAVVVPDGQRWCARCAQCRPVKLFEATPTAAEIAAHRWSPHTTRKIMRKVCAACRKTAQKRCIQSDRAARAALAVRDFEKNPTPENALQVYSDAIRRHTVASRQGLRYLQAGTPAHTFQTAKLAALKSAQQALNVLVDTGQMVALCTPPALWTRLLDPQQLAHLTALRQTCVDSMPPGRAPRI